MNWWKKDGDKVGMGDVMINTKKLTREEVNWWKKDGDKGGMGDVMPINDWFNL